MKDIDIKNNELLVVFDVTALFAFNEIKSGKNTIYLMLPNSTVKCANTICYFSPTVFSARHNTTY